MMLFTRMNHGKICIINYYLYRSWSKYMDWIIASEATFIALLLGFVAIGLKGLPKKEHDSESQK
jgi:hypothetical protein